jgi:hypothetical protein
MVRLDRENLEPIATSSAPILITKERVNAATRAMDFGLTESADDDSPVV